MPCFVKIYDRSAYICNFVRIDLYHYVMHTHEKYIYISRIYAKIYKKYKSA